MLGCFVKGLTPSTCVDGSGKVVELTESMINDDYCDCTGDGKDEYLTSACSFVPDSKFICDNKGFKSVQIYSSRVNDGVGCFWLF